MLPTVQLVTQVLDKTVPVEVRRWVPKNPIDLYLDSSVFTFDVVSPLTENLSRLDSHTEQMFVANVRSEIEKELEARARQAEWLLR